MPSAVVRLQETSAGKKVYKAAELKSPAALLNRIATRHLGSPFRAAFTNAHFGTPKVTHSAVASNFFVTSLPPPATSTTSNALPPSFGLAVVYLKATVAYLLVLFRLTFPRYRSPCSQQSHHIPRLPRPKCQLTPREPSQLAARRPCLPQTWKG